MISVTPETEERLRSGAHEIAVRVFVRDERTYQGIGGPTTKWERYLYSSRLTSVDEADRRVVRIGDITRRASYLVQNYEAGALYVELDDSDSGLPMSLTPSEDTTHWSNINATTPPELGYLHSRCQVAMGPVVDGDVPEWITLGTGIVGDVGYSMGAVSLSAADPGSILANDVLDADDTQEEQTTVNPKVLAQYLSGLGTGSAWGVSGDGVGAYLPAWDAAATEWTNDGLLLTTQPGSLVGMNRASALKLLGQQIAAAIYYREDGKLMVAPLLPVEQQDEYAVTLTEGETLLGASYRHLSGEIYNDIYVAWGTAPGDTGTETYTNATSQLVYGVHPYNITAPWLTSPVDAQALASHVAATFSGMASAPFETTLDVSAYGLLIQVGDTVAVDAPSTRMNGETWRIIATSIQDNGQRVQLRAIRTPMEFGPWAFTTVDTCDNDKVAF